MTVYLVKTAFSIEEELPEQEVYVFSTMNKAKTFCLKLMAENIIEGIEDGLYDQAMIKRTFGKEVKTINDLKDSELFSFVSMFWDGDPIKSGPNDPYHFTWRNEDTRIVFDVKAAEVDKY